MRCILGKLGRKRYDILSNRQYVDGVLKLVYPTIRSAMALGVDVSRLELKQWLLFQSNGEASAKDNNNIRLLEPHRARILVFSYDRQPETMVKELSILTTHAHKHSCYYSYVARGEVVW